MATPYIGEVKMVSYNFAPRGWALCAGQILQVNEHQTLFALIGATFGGDGRSTFALPDLRGRTPLHAGNYTGQGAKAGLEEVYLSINEMPEHTHDAVASNEPADKNMALLETNMYAKPESINIYGNPVSSSQVSFHEKAVTVAGSSATISHNNLQPSTVTNFIIAMDGIFQPIN